MRVAIVTGASAGIGLATARAFVQEGYRVVNLSRRPCPLDEVTSLATDLTSPDLETTFGTALAPHLKGAEEICIVHNAALLAKDSARDVRAEDLRRVLEVAVVAPNALNQAVLPVMPPGSSFIFVGSTLSEKAVPGAFSYVVSKHAVVGMMRALCQDLAGSGIHTACICPGFTDTEMLRAHLNEDAEILAAVGAMSAFGRLVQPTEIAETIVWAAHHPVVNGAVIHANLGQIER